MYKKLSFFLSIILVFIGILSFVAPVQAASQFSEYTAQSESFDVEADDDLFESESSLESESSSSNQNISESESFLENESSIESENTAESFLESESIPDNLLDNSSDTSDSETVPSLETDETIIAESEDFVNDDPEADRFYRNSARNDNGIVTFSSQPAKDIKAYGIDVSQFNGNIDWKKVKQAGVDFAIIRVAYRGYGTGKIVTDSKALKNLKGAQDAGIAIGAYFFSTAINEEEAVEEADYLVDIVKNYNITYPIAYDCEGYESADYRNHMLTKEERSNIAIAFLSRVEELGYKGLMYGSQAHLEGNTQWEIDRIGSKFETWVAQYLYADSEYNEYSSFEAVLGRNTNYSGDYSIWQFSSQGSIAGMSGNVDLNLEYYPEGSGSSGDEGSESTASARLNVSVQEDGNIQIIVEELNVPYDVQKVSLPVWTEKNGQDDIVWHDAVKNGQVWNVNVDLQNHNNEIGKYEIHLYCADNTGKWNFVTSTTVNVENIKKSAIIILDKIDGRFSISIPDNILPEGTQVVSLPVWTEKNGQDDIIWHNAVKNGNHWVATINAVSHKNEGGKYNVHAYYADAKGQWQMIDSTSINLNASVTSLRLEDGNNGKIIAYLHQRVIPANAQSVSFPVWSVINGQDDIIWYPAVKEGTEWMVEINPGNHKNVSGIYEIHAYYSDLQGNWNFIESTKKTVIANENALNMSVTKASINSKEFTVTIRNTDEIKNAQSIAIPVWSEYNGQDDIIWYTPSKNNDELSLTVKIADHGNDKGKYEIHLYYTDDSGNWCFVTSSSIQM